MLKRRIERLEAGVKPTKPPYYSLLAFYRFRERRDIYAVREGLLTDSKARALSPDEQADLTWIKHVIDECEADELL